MKQILKKYVTNNNRCPCFSRIERDNIIKKQKRVHQTRNEDWKPFQVKHAGAYRTILICAASTLNRSPKCGPYKGISHRRLISGPLSSVIRRRFIMLAPLVHTPPPGPSYAHLTRACAWERRTTQQLNTRGQTHHKNDAMPSFTINRSKNMNQHSKIL